MEDFGHACYEIVDIYCASMVRVILFQEVFNLLFGNQGSHCSHGEAHIIAGHRSIAIPVEKYKCLLELFQFDIGETVLKLIHVSCVLFISTNLEESKLSNKEFEIYGRSILIDLTYLRLC